MFDQKKTGSIEVNKVAAILNTMGQQFDDDELKTLCDSKAKGQFSRARVACLLMLFLQWCYNVNDILVRELFSESVD